MTRRISRFISAACIASLLAGCSSNRGPDAGAMDAAGTDAVSRPDAVETPDEPLPARSRDFTLRASSMASHEGRAMSLWVVDSTGNITIGYAHVAAVQGGDVTVRMPELVPDGDYHVDVFVDGNGNGRYDDPTTDPSWRLNVPVNGSASVSFQPSSSVTNIATPPRTARRDFRASIRGLQMSDVGQRFELRVIDAGTGATVGAYTHPQLAATSLDVALPGILDEGSSYRVDFFVDADSNGVYSGPGADHTWRETVSADGSGASLTWTRRDTFDELNWM